jgi:hypothetical protein
MKVNVWAGGKKGPCVTCGKETKLNKYGTVPKHKCPHGKPCFGPHSLNCEECLKKLRTSALAQQKSRKS